MNPIITLEVLPAANSFYANKVYRLAIEGDDDKFYVVKRESNNTWTWIELRDTNQLTAYVAKTADYLIVVTDNMVDADTSGGTFTLTLPSAVAFIAGRELTISKTDVSANVLSITTVSAQTVDGSTTVSLYGQVSITLTSNGANWIVTSGKHYINPASVRMEWFGAVGDGSADDSTPLQSAVTVAGTTKIVDFAPGKTYKIVTPPTIGDSCNWRGARRERGCNGVGMLATYPSSRINFDPAADTSFLVSKFSTTASLSDAIGPFTFENLTIDVADANGFELGREDVDSNGSSDTVTDGAGQRYVFGVRFKSCALIGTQANRESDANGVITRSGRKLIWLTKAFETVIEDTSFFGCDTQIRTWGCDKPSLRGVRMQGAHLPIDFNSSGTFGVQHTIDDLQIEGWTFSPVVVNGAALAATNARFEQNDGGPSGAGRYAIGSCTFAVTEGLATVTASRTMAGVLFPGLSILELTDGTNTDIALVTAVSGVTVTIDTRQFRFDWTAAAATGTRIHGVGPMHLGERFASFSNISVAASTDTHAFVHAHARTKTTISNATGGVTTNHPSLVLGNFYSAAFYLDALMSFDGCSPEVIADPSHPMVRVTNRRANNGSGGYDSAFRGRINTPHEDLAIARRIWSWTPKGGVTSNSNKHLIRFKRVVADPESAEAVWAWRIPAATAFYLYDATIPALDTPRYRVTVKARCTSGTGTVTIGGVGTSGSTLGTGALTTAWGVYSVVFDQPSYWKSSGTRVLATSVGLNVSADVEYDLASAVIEEMADENRDIEGSKTFNWASIADGAIASTTVTVTGAALGDFARASMSLDLQGMEITAHVSAADTVTVVLRNGTGAAVDILSGTLRARVDKV